MNDSQFNDFNIDPNGYASFDATTLRSHIIKRLGEQGVFTDQVFEGSNLSSIIDIISYSYHTLLFYLNKTSSESMFSDAQLYENMNRIVKLLNYKPTGFQTATVCYDMNVSSDLDVGTYILPRYTTVDVDGIPYVFAADILFTKPNTDSLELQDTTGEFILYQGDITEYPRYTASGSNFETVTLSLDHEQEAIDHFNINVYVNSSGIIQQYNEVESLYSQRSQSLSYEMRLNENYRYELKFGNDVNGKKLKPGDTVYIYYIKSLKDAGIIAPGTLKDKQLTLYTTPQFNLIKESIYTAGDNLLNFSTINNITLNNTTGSTSSREFETVDEIRQRAPGSFQSQNRLVTTNDFTTYISRRFGNIVNDVLTVNNDTYLSGHIDYLYNKINIAKPTLESRVLYNQARFSTPTNFNNVYLYLVPRVSRKSSVNVQTNFVPPAQKEAIKNALQDIKAIGLDVMFSDPVYMAVDIGVVDSTQTLASDIPDSCEIVLTKTDNSATSNERIRNQARDIIVNYFTLQNCKLGQLVDINKIESDILAIDGVSGISTHNTTTQATTSGLSMILWNPVYSTQDIDVYNQNVQLPYYKFPYFYDELSLLSRIKVVDS